MLNPVSWSEGITTLKKKHRLWHCVFLKDLPTVKEKKLEIEIRNCLLEIKIGALNLWMNEKCIKRFETYFWLNPITA